MQAKLQKTTLVRKEDVDPSWYLVSAEEQILGRLAARIATVLMGKHRPQYTSHVDTGDFVIVTNAEKVRVTGKKAETKEGQHISELPFFFYLKVQMFVLRFRTNFCYCSSRVGDATLQCSDVFRLWAFLTLSYSELYALSFSKSFKTRATYGAVMCK